MIANNMDYIIIVDASKKAIRFNTINDWIKSLTFGLNIFNTNT